jgi:hypothetical protein
VLKGNEAHPDFVYPSDQWRYYLLAKNFGWTIAEADDQPAVMVDWLLSIVDVVEELKAEAMNDNGHGK